MVPFPLPPQDTLLNDAVDRWVIASLNQLAYLDSIDPKKFDEAISSLAADVEASSPTRARVISTFAKLVKEWGR